MRLVKRERKASEIFLMTGENTWRIEDLGGHKLQNASHLLKKKDLKS